MTTQHDPATCRNGDHYGQCSGPTLAAIRTMPVQLGVACDGPDCETIFEGDFVVAEDSTRDERLGIVLLHVERNGWRVIYQQPIRESVTYCPGCSRLRSGLRSDP